MSDAPGDVAAKLEALNEQSFDLAGTHDTIRAAASMLRDMSKREKALREALSFYANKDNHKMRRERSYRDRFSQNMKPGRPKLSRVSEDKGRRAAKALEAK